MKIEELSFIIFELENEPDTYAVGFNRFNTKGYIDDGYGWTDEEREEFYEKILEPLNFYIDSFELSSFTYQLLIHPNIIPELEQKLFELGLKKQNPKWLD